MHLRCIAVLLMSDHDSIQAQFINFSIFLFLKTDLFPIQVEIEQAIMEPISSQILNLSNLFTTLVVVYFKVNSKISG